MRIDGKRIWLKMFCCAFIGLAVFGGTDKVEAKKNIKPKAVLGSSRMGLKNGTYQETEFNEPYSAVEYNGNVYVTDTGNHCIRKVDMNSKTVSMFTGFGISDKTPDHLKGYEDTGTAMAKFNEPRGITVDEKGTFFVADTGNHVIRKIKEGQVYTYAGTGRAGHKNGKRKETEFNRPCDLAFMNGHLYVADSLNSAIRKIDEKGEVSTVLQGNKLIEPSGLYVADNELYIVDSGAQRIFKYKAGEGIQLVAGEKREKDGQTGYRKWGKKDGTAKKARFSFPKSVVKDKKELFIADTWNSSIRTVCSGKVKTLLRLKKKVFAARPTKLLLVGKELIIVDSANHQLLIYKR